jgi:hypothetical protein
MPNTFDTYASGLNTPARSLVLITKSDSTDISSGPCRALLVGTAGTANLVDASGTEVTNVPLQQGYNPIMVRRIKTGGTAADIWALL